MEFLYRDKLYKAYLRRCVNVSAAAGAGVAAGETDYPDLALQLFFAAVLQVFKLIGGGIKHLYMVVLPYIFVYGKFYLF